MFAKNKVTKSMIDAVNQVLKEDEKKRLINDAEIDETGFHKAVHAAKRANQSHFEFQGKKYPVTAKSHKEAIEMHEASIKIPTGTGTKVLGRGYGNSAKAHEVQHKNPFEKGPSKSDLKGIKAPTKKELKNIGEEDLSEAGDCVTEPQAKKIAKKEVKGHEKSLHKESFANKLLTHVKENKSAHPEEIFTDNNLGEEEMSDKQMKKREKIILSMKKGEPGFKQRYGKNWKNVMYATATKQAMKEDSSDTWNGSYDFVISEKKEEADLDEGDAQYKKNPGTKPMTDLVDRKKTVKDLMKGRKYFGTGKVKEEVELDETVDVVQDKNAHKITTDMLSGRVPGGKLNSFKNFKVNLVTSGEEDIPKDVDKGPDTKEKQKVTTNPGPVDIKLDDKLTGPTPYTHFSDEKHITSESVELTESSLEKFLSQKGIEMKNLSYKSKIAYSKSNEFLKWRQNHQMEEVEMKHNPSNRAKELALNAMKKLKKETMMGKISN